MQSPQPQAPHPPGSNGILHPPTLGRAPRPPSWSWSGAKAPRSPRSSGPMWGPVINQGGPCLALGRLWGALVWVGGSTVSPHLAGSLPRCPAPPCARPGSQKAGWRQGGTALSSQQGRGQSRLSPSPAQPVPVPSSQHSRRRKRRCDTRAGSPRGEGAFRGCLGAESAPATAATHTETCHGHTRGACTGRTRGWERAHAGHAGHLGTQAWHIR